MEAVKELTLVLATDADAPALADISRRAFESDVDFGSPYADGPHGYASAAWQRDMMHCACGYWKIGLGSALIGGAIVFHRVRGRFYLARFYIDPDYHRRGFGREAMRRLIAIYPEARRWTLETPVWNCRTQQFYEGLGFRPLRRSNDLVIYEWIVPD